MKKKILSLLTLLCMITALLPTNITVYAETTSGTCGDNLTWMLDNNGTLTISGSGDMKNYVRYYYSPWFSYREDIQSVKISENVTSIGNWAFYKCNNLTSVTLSNTITSIGEYAFQYCSNLTSITIPDAVTSIGGCAFMDCSSLTNIAIPDRVAFIGTNAFNICNSLTNIAVSENNKEYTSDSYGILYNKNKTELMQCPAGNNITEFIVPFSVRIIDYCAFMGCNNLKTVKIPQHTDTIRSEAFYECSALTNITVSEYNSSYTSDSYGVLYNKNKEELIQYPIGSERTSFTIPTGVTEIKFNAFEGCKNLTDVIIPESVKDIYDYAFNKCNNLKSVTIGNGVKYIGDLVFGDCNNLENIYYNGTEAEWDKISMYSSYNTHLTKVTRTYFAYITIFDKDGNKVVETTQNMGETVDTSSIKVPDGYKLVLYKDQALTEEYSIDTPISENLNLYYDMIEVNKLKITGAESADIGQKGITESVSFATDKTAKDFVATIKYSDKLNFVKANSEIFDIEADEYTDDRQKYLSLTCTYKNDGNMPKNTTLNAFDLVFDVSESTTANEKLTIEFVNDETFLADGGDTYDFDSLGKAEIKVNPISVKSITINGADEIDKATQYTAVISPENATNKDIEWTVDNSEIATISADGILTPIKAGTVKIKATAKGGNDVYAEKSVNVKVYAQITSLTASAGEWDKTFTPAEREYIIYVLENTSSIKFTAQHSGTLKSETKTFYNGRPQTISLTDTETVLTLTYSQTGYTDSEYKIKIVKFEGTKTTVSEDGKSFTIKPINIDNGNIVILALYNGEEFVTMQSAVYSGKDIPFTVTDNYTTAKVMVWNNLDDITPICDVEIVKYN